MFTSRLDIFGKPSNLGNESIKKLVETITNRVEVLNSTLVEDCDNLSQIEHLAPLEFFDSITHEFMKRPFLLPSGKNVDEQTIDKLENKNLDPFTQIQFTEDYKPKYNIELKQRIDLFLSSKGQSEIDAQNKLKKKLFNI